MQRVILLAISIILCVLGVWAFYPGLSGGFQFDDYVNLPALGEYGGVRNLRTLGLYLTSGFGDPFGRPLSLLSFLVDANNWPAKPGNFLRTNLCLHLGNGLLLAAVVFRFERLLRPATISVGAIALLTSALWLIHPLQLSTVLYIVQREAMLSTTFTLLAILSWLRGKELYSAGRTRAGCAWLMIAAWVCTLFAVLCKANGLLIPPLLLLMELTVIRTPDDAGRNTSHFRKLRLFLLILPTVLLACVLVAAIPMFIDGARESRPWSLGQRLLTEPRVLVDYARLLLLPRPISRGLFHEEFEASDGLISPPSTLGAITLIMAAVCAAWFFRHRRPVLTFAIGFFLVGHALESTVVPLELYFEHRNYLPTLFLFWPLSRWLVSPDTSLYRLRHAIALSLPLALAIDTHVGAQIWGRPTQLALAWGDRNPESARAQAYAAQFEIGEGDPQAAERRLTKALQSHPFEPQLVFNLINAQCARGLVPTSSLRSAEDAVHKNTAAARLDFDWLQASVIAAKGHKCDGLNLDSLQKIVDAAMSNPVFARSPGRMQDFNHLQGILDLARNDASAALASFERATEVLPTLDLALNEAVLLADANRPDLGLRYLDAYLKGHPVEKAPIGISMKALHAWLLDHSNYWQTEVDRVHGMLENASMRDPDAKPHG